MLLQAVFDLKPMNMFTQSQYKVLASLHIFVIQQENERMGEPFSAYKIYYC